MANDNDKNSSYFILYNILSVVLKDKDIKDGVSHSLNLIKDFFNADDVILYKIDWNGDYVHRFNQLMMKRNSKIITEVLNGTKNIIEKRQYYDMNLNFNSIENILFIPIILEKTKYVLAISNSKNVIDNEFMNLFIDTLYMIINKLELINILSKMTEIDSLTGLNNRAYYEKIINSKVITDKTIYGIFDLFRLKNVNDNFSHALGDEYIIKTARILKKYFPKYIYTKDKNGKSNKVETGSCLYRIGGDEFVLISDSESYEKVMLKMSMVIEEVKNLELGIDAPLYINYGIVQGKNGDTFRDLYLVADGLLSENKRSIYQTLKLNRRK